MDALPVIAGLVSALGLLMMLISLIAYRRTGMNRILAMAGISAILMLKGILMLLGVWNVVELSYEMMAAVDLLMAFVLAGAIFGKE